MRRWAGRRRRGRTGEAEGKKKEQKKKRKRKKKTRKTAKLTVNKREKPRAGRKDQISGSGKLGKKKRPG